MTGTAQALQPARLRTIRAVGWLLVTAGAVVLLYLAYLLLYTNVETAQAQDEMLGTWELEYGPVGPVGPPDVSDSRPTTATPPPVTVGDAVAAMWFERPGSAERPVQADPLFVVEGVDAQTLKRGPGHYPDTALPGGRGNFAVAGHRTTYGAPFYDLDQLRPGDEVHVQDRSGRTWVYEVTEIEVVLPEDTWVIGPDPHSRGLPMLTLTTCYPRFSDAQRLVVFAELQP